MTVQKCVRALLCLYLILSALSLKAQELKVGDTLPPELWSLPLNVVNHPEGKETVTLNDYKGKLIILDFWATWCGSCIKGFPKLNDLQNQFGDKIKILSVTSENQTIVSKFFDSGVGKNHPYIYPVVNDTFLTKYFPHRSLPHLVWIDTQGKVLNTTRADQLSVENIENILGHHQPKMITKTDLDRSRPLFLSDHFGENMVLKSYSVFAKGIYPGLPHGHSFKRTAEGKVYGRQMTNLSMIEILRPIAYELFREKGDAFNSKRLKVAIDSAELQGPYSGGKALYSYELIVPENKADSLYHFMLADLNKYSGYSATIEKIPTDCLILIRTSETDKLQSKGGPSLNTFPKPISVLCNSPINYMLARINEVFRGDELIIDETGYAGNVDIEIRGTTDLTVLKKELSRYDLDIVRARRDLNTFVIRLKM